MCIALTMSYSKVCSTETRFAGLLSRSNNVWMPEPRTAVRTKKPASFVLELQRLPRLSEFAQQSALLADVLFHLGNLGFGDLDARF